jgi:hypothetical protein
MDISSICIDNFYQDPDGVREYALKQEYGVRGNYPGQRTEPFLNQSQFDIIQSAVEPLAGKITTWETEYTGSFQYTTARDRSWIHADDGCNWAGVCYLTPNAPITSGTGLFQHRATGLLRAPRLQDGSIDNDLLDQIYLDAQDMTKWQMHQMIGNVYNRLILYRGDLFHTSLDYFGQDLHTGRLFQTFFFSTER